VHLGASSGSERRVIRARPLFERLRRLSRQHLHSYIRCSIRMYVRPHALVYTCTRTRIVRRCLSGQNVGLTVPILMPRISRQNLRRPMAMLPVSRLSSTILGCASCCLVEIHVSDLWKELQLAVKFIGKEVRSAGAYDRRVSGFLWSTMSSKTTLHAGEWFRHRQHPIG